jgi:hypothetical protein
MLLDVLDRPLSTVMVDDVEVGIEEATKIDNIEIGIGEAAKTPQGAV